MMAVHEIGVTWSHQSHSSATTIVDSEHMYKAGAKVCQCFQPNKCKVLQDCLGDFLGYNANIFGQSTSAGLPECGLEQTFG